MQKNNALSFLFLLLCLVNLYAEWSQHKTLIYLSKPLLMIVLSIYFFIASRDFPSTFRHFILLGFIFSIGGDTLLMFVENNSNAQSYFLYGLASFLITHLCYLYAFLKWPSEQKGLLRQRPWLLLFFGFFLVGNSFFLLPDVPKAMQIPVFLYSTAILAMTAACLNLKGKIPTSVFPILMAGVLLFVLSDNVIALNKFKSHQLSIPRPRLVIMIAYLAGQYLIAKGAIALLNSASKLEPLNKR